MRWKVPLWLPLEGRLLVSNEGSRSMFLATPARPAKPLSAAGRSSRPFRPRIAATSALVLASAALRRGGHSPVTRGGAEPARGGMAGSVCHCHLAEPRPWQVIDVDSGEARSWREEAEESAAIGRGPEVVDTAVFAGLGSGAESHAWLAGAGVLCDVRETT